MSVRGGVQGHDKIVSQDWFWEDEWQVGEKEATREAAGGMGETYDSADSFVTGLAD